MAKNRFTQEEVFKISKILESEIQVEKTKLNRKYNQLDCNEVTVFNSQSNQIQ